MDKVTLGREAKKIVDNPAWDEIVGRMHKEIHDGWSLEVDPVSREVLWSMQHNLTRLIDEIEYAVRDGASEEMSE